MNVKDMVKEQTGDANFEFFYDRGVEKYKGSNTSKKIIINVFLNQFFPTDVYPPT